MKINKPNKSYVFINDTLSDNESSSNLLKDISYNEAVINKKHSVCETPPIIQDDINDDLNNDTSNYSHREDKDETKIINNTRNLNVFDVAKYILDILGSTTTMKLQKLVYYCQAWSLVWDDKELFPEKIEAWANGPVVRELFTYLQGLFIVTNKDLIRGNPKNLNSIQQETIEAVIKYYGDKPSQWLIDLTHNEDPWKNARIGYDPFERGTREITHSSMVNYYSSL